MIHAFRISPKASHWLQNLRATAASAAVAGRYSLERIWELNQEPLKQKLETVYEESSKPTVLSFRPSGRHHTHSRMACTGTSQLALSSICSFYEGSQAVKKSKELLNPSWLYLKVQTSWGIIFLEHTCFVLVCSSTLVPVQVHILHTEVTGLNKKQPWK